MIRFLLFCYMFLLLLDFFASLFPALNQAPWIKTIRQWTEPSLVLVRRFIPLDLAIDFSAIILIGFILLLMKLW